MTFAARRLPHSSPTYVAYSDESNVTDARYRSICAVSFPADQLASTTGELAGILTKAKVAEFKWKQQHPKADGKQKEHQERPERQKAQQECDDDKNIAGDFDE